MRFSKDVVVVTGGGSGIGKSACLAFAREGAYVCVACRTAKAGISVVEEIEQNGGKAIFCQTDVGNAEQVQHMIEKTVSTFGRLDVLFNNAGTSSDTPLEHMPESVWDKILDTNLKGHFLCSKAAIPFLKKTKGCIVNMSSVLARACLPNNVAYCASKAGIEGFTKALSLELGPLGVRVNAVLPGSIDTPMMWTGVDFKELNTVQKEVAQAQPIQRYGTPDDIAELVLFLADKTSSSFITGSCFIIDGGLLSRIATTR